MSRSFDAQLQALEDSIVRRVELRSQAVYWLLRDKNKDLVSILSTMGDSSREKLLLKQVLPTYEEARWFLNYLTNLQKTGHDKMQQSLKFGNKRVATEYADDLVTIGESYSYWHQLYLSSKDIIDALWKLGVTIPIADVPDDDEDGDRQDVPPYYALFDSAGSRMHRAARATTERMDDQEPTSEEPRSRPMDEVTERRRKVQMGDEGDDSPGEDSGN